MVQPLLGDANGKYRVHVVGNCGEQAGEDERRQGTLNPPLPERDHIFFLNQSTVGKQLAHLLGVPFISLDALFWTPGWGHVTNEELRARVVEAMAAADAQGGWVIDGNYKRRIGSLVEDAETDVIWLDPPLALTLPRVIWRTFLRLLRLAEPCSPGCPERAMEVFFSKESIVWWCITHHGLVRRREAARMALIGLDEGSDVEGRRMRRLGGWGAEVNAWLEDVKRMLRNK